MTDDSNNREQIDYRPKVLIRHQRLSELFTSPPCARLCSPESTTTLFTGVSLMDLVTSQLSQVWGETFSKNGCNYQTNIGTYT